ncbi:zinc finger, CCHC-type containing protein [Tanacetum coccineum]
MGDKNPIRTLGDYSKPSNEGYRNTIELSVGNNVVPLRSDTIRLVQNRCSFHGLRSEDPNQHLKYFLKLVDSLDLDGDNRERMRLRLFQFSLRDQASNWLEHLLAGSITTWEDLTTRFLAQFFPPGRTTKLRNDILMFQQHHGESLSEAWTRFKDLLQKVPNHGIDLWIQNDPRDFAKPVKAIALPQVVPRILPSDTVKNPKLGTHPSSCARSYPTLDLQCSSHSSTSINAIKAHFNEAIISQTSLQQPVVEIKPQQPEEPELTLEDEFKDLHLKLSVLEVLSHIPIYNAY